MRPFIPLLALVGTLAAQETLILQSPRATHSRDKTQVEVTALFGMPAPTGYLPLRVTIDNQRKDDGRIRLDCRSSFGYGDHEGRLDSSFTLDSEAGTRRVHDLLVPLTTTLNHAGHSSYGNPSFNVTLGGSFGSGGGSISSNFHPDLPAVLLSEALHNPNASSLDAEVGKLTSYGSHAFAARFRPDAMPEDWRAYSGYDALILTDDDWSKLGPGARHAILQWCRLGGQLDVHPLGDATTFRTLDIDVPGNGDIRPYGFGRVALRENPTAALGLDASTIIARYRGLPAEPLQQSIREDYSNRWPLHRAFGSQTFNYGIFVVVLIAFGILVGPVNLFVFAKSGQRHRMFLTTPLISLGTSALLVVLILFKDGTGGRGQRVALIEVRPDAGENAAYVLQEQVSRTGVLVGGGFRLEEDAAISPVPVADNPWARLTPGDGGGGLRYNANFDDGELRVSGDWFQSRSEQGQLVRAVVPTRGRIELRGDTGDPVLLSTFEFPIETLHFIDANGGHWLAENLEPGVSVTARPQRQPDHRLAVRQLGEQLGERHRELFGAVADRRGHFIATAADAPAIDTFDAIRWQETLTILTGPVAR